VLSITKDTLIEQIVEAYPDSVGFLIDQGLPCVVCGEPFWGTVADLARQKGWEEDRIAALVEGLKSKFA
jgi:hypothetical protein